MRDALSRILILPEEQEDDEQLYDIARAYGLLVSVCGSAGPPEHNLCSTKVGQFSISGCVGGVASGTLTVRELGVEKVLYSLRSVGV